MALKTLTHNDYTVGWVCALPKEQTAAIAMLDERHGALPKPLNDHNAYILGSVGKHNVVIACLPKGRVGNNSAATVVARMISTFPSIKFGLMVGIGGGIPPKVRLGDVVVSTPIDEFPGVVQWDFGKAEQGGNFKRIGSLNNPPSALLTALSTLETEHEMNGSKIPEYLDDLKRNWPRLAPKYTTSNSLEDVLFKSDYSHVTKDTPDSGSIPDNEDGEEEEKSCRFCDKTKVVKRKPRDMLVHYGLIASGNQVIKDAAFRDTLNKNFGGHVLCVEMEAAGLLNDFPCIAIRGICDYADSHKTKDWQEHAAAIAAAFAKELLSIVLAQEVEQMPTIKSLYGSIMKLSKGMNEVLSRQHDQEHQAILDWLTPIDYTAQQADYIRRRQPGTGQWLLNCAEYQAWLRADGETLFCPGIPGAGKTIVTSIVVDDLKTRFQNPRISIAYLYCNFRRRESQKAEDLLASLLKQLSQKASLPDGVKILYGYHEEKQTHPSLDEISITLQSVATGFSRVFIVVDAIDECEVSDGCRARFLSEIFNLQTKCGINLFATSRFIPHITEKFKGSTLLEIRASEEDVRSYLEGHMLQLPGFVVRSPELQENIKIEILRAVNGMFLLAQLHLNSLIGKRSPKAIRNALAKLPTGNDAYDHAYEDAMERIERQVADAEELAKQVLFWITCARRPLTASEVRHALAVEFGTSILDEQNLPEIEDMVSVCAGLVTVEKESEIIRLVHYTTQEYLERRWTHWFPKAQSDITKVCVTYLLFDTFEGGFCLTDHDFENRLRSNVLYNYATRNWGYHARSASMESDELVLDFLKSEAKLSSSSQAMICSDGERSQQAPKQVTGLHVAAHFGMRNAIIALIRNGYDIDTNDSDCETPLSYAAKEGHEEVVQLLLEKNAKLNSPNKNRSTPISFAAGRGHEEVFKILLEKGADAELKDDYGWTPLTQAAATGREAIVKILLETGVEVDPMAHEWWYTDENRTPLSFAAENGHEAVVRLLLESNAKVDSEADSKVDRGRTPLSFAAQGGHSEVIKALLEYNARVDSEDRTKYNAGRTPLSFAAERGHETAVKLLLENNALVDSEERTLHHPGWTPLSYAAEFGHERVVRLLLENNAQVDAKSGNGTGAFGRDGFSDGWTPLSYAAKSGHETVVRLLLENGAKVDSKDSKGRSPLFHAVEGGHETVVKLLLKNGPPGVAEDNLGYDSSLK